MHIVVDASHIRRINKEEESHTLALLQKLIKSQSGHQFTIVTTQADWLPALPNIQEYMVAYKITNYLQLRWWYSKILPGILKKTGANMLLNINGSVTNLTIRQVVLLSSASAMVQPFANSFFSFLVKKYLNKQVAKANTIATITVLQQQMIAKQLKLSTHQIVPVGYCVPTIFIPVGWQLKEEFMQEYSNGCEFFLYAGPFDPDTFLLVLKAFSLFKKRQLSSMQLIIAGQFINSKNVTEKLTTYKYRADVKLYENAGLQVMAMLYAAAYGIIYLDETASTAYPAAIALKCGVPVISAENCMAVKELASTNACYTLLTPEGLAEQMKQLYKDENLRKQLVTNGAQQMQLIDGDIAIQKLWTCLQPTGE